MKALHFFGLILLITFFSCTPNNIPNHNSIENEIENLKTTEAKRSYLESIFRDDQKLRGGHGQQIMIKYGPDSKEYKEYIQHQIKQDAENLLKIETYMAKHRHPNKSEVGERAAVTPWAVIHHAQGYEVREKNFAILYQAYVQGDIDEGQLSMFLGRMYRIKNGHSFEMKTTHTAEDEINQLIIELNLEKVNEPTNLNSKKNMVNKDLKKVIERIRTSEIYESQKNWIARGLNQSDQEVILILRNATNDFLEKLQEIHNSNESSETKLKQISSIVDELPWGELDTEEREFMADELAPAIKAAGFDPWVIF